jgi:hypothetical protein
VIAIAPIARDRDRDRRLGSSGAAHPRVEEAARATAMLA